MCEREREKEKKRSPRTKIKIWGGGKGKRAKKEKTVKAKKINQKYHRYPPPPQKIPDHGKEIPPEKWKCREKKSPEWGGRGHKSKRYIPRYSLATIFNNKISKEGGGMKFFDLKGGAGGPI